MRNKTEDNAVSIKIDNRETQQTAQVDLRKLMTYHEDGRCTNAFNLITSKPMLLAAYWSLRSKPGMMTKGSDEETLDNISMKWFEKTSEDLTKERYQPKPARRVYIPKPNGKKRPLGIASPRDRIIQQAMKMVLEYKLEPTFLETSHGFRPNKSCHTALKEIRSWKGVAWFVEGDIKGFFDNIDHRILANLLQKHFKDTRLINLYWKFVKAGYIEWDTKKIQYTTSEMGVPQGGIISPLLSNLILNEFDAYVDKLKKEWDKKRGKEKDKIINPIYDRTHSRLQYLKKKIQKKGKFSAEYYEIKKEIREVVKKQRQLNSSIPNPKAHPIFKYVRYADDWIIGIWGSRKAALELKTNLKEFLRELKLTLSEEKTLVTNAKKDKARFLGIEIKRFASNRSTILTKSNVLKRNRRIPSGNIWMALPLQSIVHRLVTKGFIERKKKKWVCKTKLNFISLPMRDVILRYRAIYNGFYNYYRFTDNIKQIRKIYWILKESLRKTLSRKFKLAKRNLLKKYGEYLEKNCQTSGGSTTSINFYYPIPTKNPMDFATNIEPVDPLYAGLWKIRTITSLGEKCSSCESTQDLEMHHLKHIRTINVKLSPFDRDLAKINRKQILLCKECHTKVHKGEYKGKSLKHLASKKRQTE